MKKALRIVGIVLVIVILAALIYGLIHPRAARAVWHNVTSPTLKMNTAPWTAGASYERLPYADISESDYLDLYIPESEEPLPLMVIVHGGGFVYNDSQSRQAQFMYRYFRDHGYACATVNYRLAGEAPYPASIEDVKAAVRFLRANADTYGYDAEHITIFGESAGGYLASMAAFTSDEEFSSVKFIGEEELSEPVSGKISTLLDYYGAVLRGSRNDQFDAEGIPHWIPEVTMLTWETGGYSDVESYWLRRETSTMTEQEILSISPVYYLEKNAENLQDLHVVIVHGDADICVPMTQSLNLHELSCRLLGEDNTDLVIIPKCKHADDRMYTDEVLANIAEFLK